MIALPAPRVRLLFFLSALLLAFGLAPHASAQRVVPATGKSDALSELVVEDLTGALTPTDLANALVGEGVSIANVSFTGSLLAAGGFAGGEEIVGFSDGFVLSTGAAVELIGPNEFDGLTTDFGLPGDADLTALSGFPTKDAVVLAFDFVPDDEEVFFNYVFASDEYNEYVNTTYNDVFAFYVNGVNCALVDGDPVGINTVNNGNPSGDTTPSHPELYINNDLDDGGGAIDTEMDGLTQVLACSAAVEPNQTNTLKLAIADASDGQLDSAVFVEAGSLTTIPTDVGLVSFSGTDSAPVNLVLFLSVAVAAAMIWRRSTRSNT